MDGVGQVTVYERKGRAPSIAFADSRIPKLRVSETLRKGESVADGARRLHAALREQPVPGVASDAASRELKHIERALNGRTWTTEHWPAARRREAQRFAETPQHSRFSECDEMRLGSRHARMREES